MWAGLPIESPCSQCDWLAQVLFFADTLARRWATAEAASMRVFCPHFWQLGLTRLRTATTLASMVQPVELAKRPESAWRSVVAFRVWLRRGAVESSRAYAGAEAEYAFALGQVDRALASTFKTDGEPARALESLLGRLELWDEIARRCPRDARALAFTAAAAELRSILRRVGGSLDHT